MKLGIVGLGNIGTIVLNHAIEQKMFDMVYVHDINKERVISLGHSKIIQNVSLDDLIEKSDVIFESATKEALAGILSNKNLDRKGKKLIVMSVSGLISNYDKIKKLKACKFILPSGAIAGLDAIGSARGRIDSLQITTTKPLAGLEGAPFIIKNRIRLDKKRKQQVFSGSLKEAIEGFPQNINVAATLFLASGFEDLNIKIISDPKINVNRHEIVCEGSFGKIRTVTENLPSKNPRTSYLAILSAIKALDSIEEKIVII